MIPISELPGLSDHLESEAKKFEQQFITFAGTHTEIRDLALQFGDGIWRLIKPKLNYSTAATEHKFGTKMADGWVATLTTRGWMYHYAGVTADRSCLAL